MVAAILHWVVSSVALALTAAIVPGFKLRGFTTALMATIILGILNYLLWPVLVFFTLPFIIITFGLFIIIVNAIVLRVCAWFMKDFEIDIIYDLDPLLKEKYSQLVLSSKFGVFDEV